MKTAGERLASNPSSATAFCALSNFVAEEETIKPGLILLASGMAAAAAASGVAVGRISAAGGAASLRRPEALSALASAASAHLPCWHAYELTTFGLPRELSRPPLPATQTGPDMEVRTFPPRRVQEATAQEGLTGALTGLGGP